MPCLAMHRRRLDVSNSQYMVSETVRRERFGTPKTGRRLIDLPEPLVCRLENHIKALRKEALKAGSDAGYLSRSFHGVYRVGRSAFATKFATNECF